MQTSNLFFGLVSVSSTNLMETGLKQIRTQRVVTQLLLWDLGNRTESDPRMSKSKQHVNICRPSRVLMWNLFVGRIDETFFRKKKNGRENSQIKTSRNTETFFKESQLQPAPFVPQISSDRAIENGSVLCPFLSPSRAHCCQKRDDLARSSKLRQITQRSDTAHAQWFKNNKTDYERVSSVE